MKIYEAVLKGFNGNTDKTDHLIKWIAAPSLKKANDAIKKADFELSQPLELLPLSNVPSNAIDINVC
jgi:hypothetical protein